MSKDHGKPRGIKIEIDTSFVSTNNRNVFRMIGKGLVYKFARKGFPRSSFEDPDSDCSIESLNDQYQITQSLSTSS